VCTTARDKSLRDGKLSNGLLDDPTDFRTGDFSSKAMSYSHRAQRPRTGQEQNAMSVHSCNP
jgi:hypothetical protein